MRTLRAQPAMLAPLLMIAAAVGLGACTRTRATLGAALNPGDAATLRLLGGPMQVEISNVGNQRIDYSMTEDGVPTSGGTIAPGGRVGASRHAGDLLVRVSNPGPDPAEAELEAHSARGMEFTREPAGG